MNVFAEWIWDHDMEKLSALPALCDGNAAVNSSTFTERHDGPKQSWHSLSVLLKKTMMIVMKNYKLVIKNNNSTINKTKML